MYNIRKSPELKMKKLLQISQSNVLAQKHSLGIHPGLNQGVGVQLQTASCQLILAGG